MPQIDCDAVLFDLDGVLIDSTECILRHWQQWALEHEIEMADVMRVVHGRRTVETIRLIAPQLSAEDEARKFASVEAAETEGVRVIEGAAVLLTSLPPDAWAIVTSGTRDVATARLKWVGLSVPRVLITSEDVVRGKPDPEPYLVAAARLGLAADRCAVIEDSPAGIESARSAGMQTVAVTTTHARQDLAGADMIAAGLGDIRVRGGAGGRLSLQI
jgi:sugar-phosphatase